MSKPIVAVYSQDSRLTSLLPQFLEHSYQLSVCTSADAVAELCQTQIPCAVVADFAKVEAGGHAEDRLLGEWQQSMPNARFVMITENDCPEPLERRAACSHITHLRGRIDSSTLAEVLHDQVPVEVDEPAHETDHAVGRVNGNGNGHVEHHATEESASVLTGMTRQFETNTARLRNMLRELEVAARHDVTILLIGETGAGKTFLSRLIHEVSPRHDEPFLHVACGALPAELIESELFGHVKGAFTSAHSDKDGKFLAAGRGTILLDEIDVLGPEQQVKLLRVIETGEFEPVGSNTTYKCQARLVVASNLQLQPLVDEGKFRPDLYYRLNMLKFDLPPLRERRPDVVPLARKFLQQSADRHEVGIECIDDSLYEALLNYPWPGNVRELENVIQRAVIYCQNGKLTADHLPAHIVNGSVGPTNDPSVELGESQRNDTSLGKQMAFTERDIIEQALVNNNYSRTKTARELGISRVTLYNKMKKYGMLG